MTEAAEKVVAIVENNMGSKADFVHLECKGDDSKVMFELGSRPWTSMKVASKQDIAEMEFDKDRN